MNFKLLCTDIDGTLLNKERKLSFATIKEIKRIKNMVPVILISSRMPKAIRHLQEELDILDLPLIAYNGGLVLDGDKTISDTQIPLSIVSDTIKLCNHTSIHLSLYHQDDWFVPTMDYWAKREENNTKVIPTVQGLEETITLWKDTQTGAHKIMAMGEEAEISRLFTALNNLHGDSVTLYRSKPTYIEIAHKSISKETAIRQLLRENYPKLSMSQLIAFGDNYNDIEMLKAVGMGVAVQNAKPEVLKIANASTTSNIDDGVALAIREYFV